MLFRSRGIRGRHILLPNQYSRSVSPKIPHWTPYQLRHAAATAMEDEAGLDEAQALLDHSSAQTTKWHAHAGLKNSKNLRKIGGIRSNDRTWFFKSGVLGKHGKCDTLLSTIEIENLTNGNDDTRGITTSGD